MCKLYRYSLLLAAVMWLAGCFELEPMTRLSWKEEVELSDGTVILVERSLAGNGGIMRDSDFEIKENNVKVLDAKGLPPRRCGRTNGNQWSWIGIRTAFGLWW